MLAYSANRPAVGARGSSPNSMLVIIAVHVAAVAVLMSAKMDLPTPLVEPPLVIDTIQPEPAPPKPIDQPRLQRAAPAPDSALIVPDPAVTLPVNPTAIPGPAPLPDPGPAVTLPGSGAGTAAPIAATPAVLLTGAAELKPPYPPSKLASGEEAALKLRLTVDHNGRVTSVELLGRADPAFLAAARRHILRHWRYRPATSDGHGVATSLVITLRFQLDD